jgi:hypothetical protein
MSKHTFRNPDLYQVLGPREAIREWMPDGDKGFVATDLDLVLRWFGQNYDTDAVGRVALIELKHGSAPLAAAQTHTFGLIDALFRAGDPDGKRYAGFYVVHSENENWLTCDKFKVNGVSMNQPEFRRWLSCPDLVEGRSFSTQRRGLAS